jgi:hypothetical protein
MAIVLLFSVSADPGHLQCLLLQLLAPAPNHRPPTFLAHRHTSPEKPDRPLPNHLSSQYQSTLDVVHTFQMTAYEIVFIASLLSLLIQSLATCS